MAETSVCRLTGELIEIFFTCVTERSVTYIVSESDSLDQIEIKPESRADRSRDPGNELNVKRPSRNIVVSVERKHLGLVCIAVIVRTVKDLVDVADESRAPDAGTVAFSVLSAYDIAFVKRKGPGSSVFSIVCYSLRNLLRK
jgi:hypothetical protein